MFEPRRIAEREVDKRLRYPKGLKKLFGIFNVTDYTEYIDDHLKTRIDYSEYIRQRIDSLVIKPDVKNKKTRSFLKAVKLMLLKAFRKKI